MRRYILKELKEKFRLLMLFVVVGFSLPVYGQSTDSLILKYTDDKGKVNIKSALEASKSRIYSHPVDTFNLAKQTLRIAERQKAPLALAQSYQFMGSCYFQVKADYDSAVYFLQKAEKMFHVLHEKDAVEGNAMVLHNFGSIKQVKGEYALASDYYMQALKLFDEDGNKNFYAYTLNNISTMYALVQDNQQAEKYARVCIALSLEVNDEFMEATGSIALSDALLQQGKYGEIVPLLERVLAYGERNNDPYKILLYHLNYGTYLMRYKKDYPSAVKE